MNASKWVVVMVIGGQVDVYAAGCDWDQAQRLADGIRAAGLFAEVRPEE